MSEIRIELASAVEMQRLFLSLAERVDELRRRAEDAETRLLTAGDLLLCERAEWMERVDALRQQLDAKQAELDTVIAAHKHQVDELTNALAPVNWEPERVPTEPGLYAWCKSILAPVVIQVFEHHGALCVDAGGWSVEEFARRYPNGRWLGPVVLPCPRPEIDIDAAQVKALGTSLAKGGTDAP